MADYIKEIEETGNIFIDDYVIPALKTGKDIALNNSISNALKSFNKHSYENKINIFINSMKSYSKEQTIKEIHKMNDNQKVFFLEAIGKILNFNDEIQLNILAYLTTEYSEKGSLDDWQKNLYYHINTLSDDNYRSFCKVIEESKEYSNYGNTYYYLSCEDPKLDSIREKFISIGILIPEAKERLGNIKNFSIPYHGRLFYQLVSDIIKKIDTR